MVNEIVFVKSSHRREQEEKSTEGENALPFSAMCARDAVSFFSSCEKATACNDKGEDIDILEQNIRELSPYLLKILLQDKTTGRFIRWACDEYIRYGEAYAADKEILPELITGANTRIIQPRTAKSKAEQQTRTRKAAEVFTPGWICNEMLNHCDEEWFGRPNVFNFAEGKSWRPVDGRILFADDGKRKKPAWQRYVDSRCLEITCGEAPFLVGRYDTTTGEFFPIEKRIGVLDRKLRVVHENTDNEAEWFKWTKRAFEATYGYEYQGDNLLLARENLLLTFIDNYQYKFRRFPTIAQLKQMANIIAWNVWQMDGLKECAPFAAAEASQLELFDDLPTLAFPIICRLKDWRNKRVLFFRDLKGDKKMKFDYVIGNPPYQEEQEGYNKTFTPPVYHNFLDNAYRIANVVEMIHPARFLFNAGNTPKEWNQKMLANPHVKIVKYERESSNIFSNTSIKGGVVITYYDSKKNFGEIGVFSPYSELNSIREKIVDKGSIYKNNLMNIMYNQVNFDLEQLYKEYPNYRNVLGSNGKDRRLEKNIFVKLNIFTSERKDQDDIKILGIVNNKRQYKYISQRFIDKSHENLFRYKVLVPRSNGSGAIGEVLSTPLIGSPLIGSPLIGYTRSFISIGCFDSSKDANRALNYVKTKFARTMLGILKVTQDNPIDTWFFVPLQDFTENSDIDWSKSIHEIDLQLYEKYGLDDNEINFIETHVKPME